MMMHERRSGASSMSGDARSPWGIDYSRIVHSSSFRRLQGKTQILSVGDGDFHRTRLTHSLETAQIAEGILERLTALPQAAELPAGQLVRAIALAHDLGHPPFGHSGESALNASMAGSGGFEGNGQTLRILSRLEYFSDGFGADLTRRAMLGILKYPLSYAEATAARGIRLGERAAKPPKCYLDAERDVVDWLLADFTERDAARMRELLPSSRGPKPIHRTLDCTIMEVADDVAYGVHDLEDAIALGMVSQDRCLSVMEPEKFGPFLSWLGRLEEPRGTAYDRERFISALFGPERSRKRSIGLLVHFMIASVGLVQEEQFEHALLRDRATLGADARAILDGLQDLIVTDVIGRPSVQQLEFKGRRVVEAVFDAYRSDPSRLLPGVVRREFEEGMDGDRIICDHVAAMTDAGIVRIYERLYVARSGSPFDLL